MRNAFLFGFILVALLLSGCTEEDDGSVVPGGVLCPDGSHANSLSDCLSTVEPAACTEEAKVCPDGTTVGRNPTLGCGFDPCPEVQPEPSPEPSPEPEPGFKIVNEHFFCELSHYSSSFGLELYNRGTENVPENAIIKLLLENDDSTYDFVREDVEPGKRFWQSMKSARAGFRGRTFVLNTGTLGEELVLDYWILYCPPGTSQGNCNLETGDIIQMGNTADCNSQGYDYG